MLFRCTYCLKFKLLVEKCFDITRRPVDDPEVKTLQRIDDDLFKEFGAGVLEDVFPYFKDVIPTAKWRKLVNIVNELLAILRAKFKEHVDTFEPGYPLQTFSYHIFMHSMTM
jgi:hypothetical protein